MEPNSSLQGTKRNFTQNVNKIQSVMVKYGFLDFENTTEILKKYGSVLPTMFK
jgi:hypothetical protein